MGVKEYGQQLIDHLPTGREIKHSINALPTFSDIREPLEQSVPTAEQLTNAANSMREQVGELTGDKVIGDLEKVGAQIKGYAVQNWPTGTQVRSGVTQAANAVTNIVKGGGTDKVLFFIF